MRAILWAFYCRSCTTGPGPKKLLMNRRYALMASNVSISLSGEMDIVAWRKSGFIDEIEIKLTKSDFLADFKKTTRIQDGFILNTQCPNIRRVPKHEALADGLLIPNYFSFLMPAALADRCEIPAHAGLYVFEPDMWGGRIREPKHAPRLHSRKSDNTERQHTAEKMAWRYWRTLEQK